MDFLVLLCFDALQLFFMVVHKRHWAVVVVNITQKEFNIFDSIRNSEDLFEMDRITKNVVMLLLEFGATNLFLLFCFSTPHTYAFCLSMFYRV